ncbi:MAG: MBL fold metallo-hydrolase [Verrucomicrobiae bacterium]|nr:MBL fold metallo-hydrolase [Verrucomicrobiae bacterium]
MKVTFLGTGTSQGVPLVACDCAVCTSTDPRNKRYRSSIYVETNAHKILVDTTVDFRWQCLDFNIRRIDAVLITHCHADHVMGLDDIRRFNSLQNDAIPLYGSRESVERLRQVFPYAVRHAPIYPGYPCVHGNAVEGPFTIGDTKITPVTLPHGKTNVYGYIFQEKGASACAYLTDCDSVPVNVLEQIRGVPVLILDALRANPHPTHMSIGEALAVVNETKPKRTYFIHMCHEVDHESTNKLLPTGVELSYDGLQVEC